MLNIQMIRTRCRELLAQAEAKGNERNIRKFRNLSAALLEDDCFSDPEKRNIIHFPVLAGFPREEKEEFYRHMEEANRFPGILYCSGVNDNTFPVKTILEPSVEHYCQFSNRTVCIIRNETSFYYRNSDGKRFYDGSLQSWFEDSQYACETLRYTLFPKTPEKQEEIR